MKHFALVVGFLGSSCALGERHTACAEGDGTAEIFGVLDCDLCASRSCCPEASACAADAGCVELMRCLRDCTEASCFRECRATIPHDAARANALVDCIGAHCEADHCPLPERISMCNDLPAITDVFHRTSCDLCIRRTLCEAAAACGDRLECRTRLECMGSCVGPELNPACFDRCRDDGQLNVGDAQFFTAVARDCRGECAIGSEFSCVDAYAWPTTNDDYVDVTYRAINRTTNQGFAGLVVTACAAKPGACDPVSVPPTVTTVESGDVTLTVPTRNGFEDGVFSGFRGYLSWEDPTGDPDNWIPTLLFHMRPDYRTRVPDEVAPFATRELLTTLFELIAGNDPPTTIDATRGYLVGGVVDCHGSYEFFAHDLVLEIEGADDATRIVYANKAQDLPDFTATATTESGQWVSINVPTGSRHVSLRHAQTGNVVADSTVEIRSDTLTVFAAWPNAK